MVLVLCYNVVVSVSGSLQQVHTDFKRQFLDLTVDKLLEQFVLNKYTGLEKPGELNIDI